MLEEIIAGILGGVMGGVIGGFGAVVYDFLKDEENIQRQREEF